MGEAKQRGTFEHRREQSVADQEAARKILKEQENKYLQSLSEEERENILKNRQVTKYKNKLIRLWNVNKKSIRYGK